MPTRIRNWDVALVTWALEQQGQPFAWGETDCGSLVRRAVAVMYGEDLVPDLTYHDGGSVARVLLEHGGVRDHLERLGAELIPPTLLQTGDIVLLPSDHPPYEGAFVAAANVLLGAHPARGVELGPREVAMLGVAYRLPWDVAEPGDARPAAGA